MTGPGEDRVQDIYDEARKLPRADLNNEKPNYAEARKQIHCSPRKIRKHKGLQTGFDSFYLYKLVRRPAF